MRESLAPPLLACCHPITSPLQIDRVHTERLSLERFRSVYERPRRPLVITGLADDWPGDLPHRSHACMRV